jgi:hypothetical protein
VLPAGFFLLTLRQFDVEMKSELAEEIDTAKRAFAATPEVQQCHYVTGEFDFVLVVLVPDMETTKRSHDCFSSATTTSNAPAPSSQWIVLRWDYPFLSLDPDLGHRDSREDGRAAKMVFRHRVALQAESQSRARCCYAAAAGCASLAPLRHQNWCALAAGHPE